MRQTHDEWLNDSFAYDRFVNRGYEDDGQEEDTADIDDPIRPMQRRNNHPERQD